MRTKTELSKSGSQQYPHKEFHHFHIIKSVRLRTAGTFFQHMIAVQTNATATVKFESNFYLPIHFRSTSSLLIYYQCTFIPLQFYFHLPPFATMTLCKKSTSATGLFSELQPTVKKFPLTRRMYVLDIFFQCIGGTLFYEILDYLKTSVLL